MKLWQKVSVISVMVLLLVVITCGALLTFYARDSIIELTIQQAKSEQINLQTSFSEMTSYYLNGTENFVVEQSLIKYCFSRFANETSVLTCGNETLYSGVNIEPQTILQMDGNNAQRFFLNKIDGRNILIVGNEISILSSHYSIYVVKDVTSIYVGITAMILRFVLICAIGVLIGTLLVTFLVRRTIRPLVKLKETTCRIAVGEYSKRANIGTKDEVGALARDFNTMVDAVQSHIARLEDTAKRQQFLIGGLTHEFKTPMTSMLIHTDTLLTANLTGDETQNSLAHIHAQCRWLERLTKKMLQLITLDEEIKMQEESVSELFEDVHESTFESLKERGTPLIIEYAAEPLNFDYDLMKSLLINLVENASKASEAGQAITLYSYDAVIEVIDHGKGIPKDEIVHITDPFYMVDRSRSKLKSGSGLGLSLVKRIAEAHKAELVIESELGKGTTVRIIFPVNKTLNFS